MSPGSARSVARSVLTSPLSCPWHSAASAVAPITPCRCRRFQKCLRKRQAQWHVYLRQRSVFGEELARRVFYYSNLKFYTPTVCCTAPCTSGCDLYGVPRSLWHFTMKSLAHTARVANFHVYCVRLTLLDTNESDICSSQKEFIPKEGTYCLYLLTLLG